METAKVTRYVKYDHFLVDLLTGGRGLLMMALLEFATATGLRTMAATLPWDHAIPFPLVGRAHELAMLRDRLAFAVEGRGNLVLVGGEAGIGKSALVETLAREATAASCLVLTGHCYDLTATPPYSPWQGLTANGSDNLPAPLATALAATLGSSEVDGQSALFTGVRDGLTA